MEVGNRVVTPDGKGTICSINPRTIQVMMNGKFRYYTYDKIDLVYDPLGKMDKPNTALQFIIGIDAHRLFTEYRFNPYVLASSTKIKLFPHQINAVIWGLENPRILIADEVGLGKTITAALIISELRARGIAKRLLFVVPKSLQIKWKNELEQRFDIPTEILDAAYVRSHAMFGDSFSYVASIDYLKQDHVMSQLAPEFDAVVVDEAHKMNKKTNNLKLGKHLAAKTDVLILLTATPHDGSDENFMARINLLDKFATDIQTASYLWTRNIKEKVVDLDGKSVFPARTSKTIEIPLSDKERKVLNMLEDYFNFIQSRVRTPQENNMIRFLRHIYKKRASSSFYSLEMSLRSRLDKLGLNFDADKIMSMIKEDADEYLEDTEDVDAVTILDAEEERRAIKPILDALEDCNHDSKLEHLVSSIRKLKTDKPDAKLVVFTEYKDTLKYLAESLDYKVGIIDGTMSITTREQSLDEFRNSRGNEILLCTDAAGEGIDMQFCNMEINYDIPWNPNRLEQRMGRIHRIGQDQEVFYYNYVLDPKISIDGYIMQKLLDKIESIKRSMGDVVYDIMGLLIGPDEFGRYYDELRRIPNNQWEPKIKALLSEIESMKRDVQEKRSMLLEGNKLDPSGVDTIQKMRENAVVIHEVKRFLQTFVESSGGKMRLVNDKNRVYEITPTQRHAQELELDRITGVFDRDIAQQESYDYLALGHSGIDKIINKAISDYVASLGHETQDGVLCVYKITVLDGESRQRDSKIAAFYEQTDGVIHQVDARSMWSYKDSDAPINPDAIIGACGRIREFVLDAAGKQKSKVDQKLRVIKRKTQDARKSHYGNKISKLNGDIHELQQQPDEPNIEKIINSKRREIKNLRNSVSDDLAKLDETYQTRTKEELIGVAQITADNGVDLRLQVDEAGMKAVLDYERSRTLDAGSRGMIRDCSRENCGYDVATFDSRRIEVKSHRTTGNIMLTNHEWATAQRLQDDYWIYVVENVFDNPHITEIQNPAQKYGPFIERIPTRQFRWVINDWQRVP